MIFKRLILFRSKTYKFGRINNEISQGNNNVYINGSISLNARQMLEQLGYDVKCGSQYNESYVNIEW